MSSEPWEEKRIHRGEVISAWLVVLIELVVVLMIFGMSASNCCEPNHAKAIRTASPSWSHVFVPQASAPNTSHAAEGDLALGMPALVSQSDAGRIQPRLRRRSSMLARKVLEQSAQLRKVSYPQGTAFLDNDPLFLKPAELSCDRLAMGADTAGDLGMSRRR